MSEHRVRAARHCALARSKSRSAHVKPVRGGVCCTLCTRLAGQSPTPWTRTNVPARDPANWECEPIVGSFTLSVHRVSLKVAIWLINAQRKVYARAFAAHTATSGLQQQVARNLGKLESGFAKAPCCMHNRRSGKSTLLRCWHLAKASAQIVVSAVCRRSTVTKC